MTYIYLDAGRGDGQAQPFEVRAMTAMQDGREQRVLLGSFADPDLAELFVTTVAAQREPAVPVHILPSLHQAQPLQGFASSYPPPAPTSTQWFDRTPSADPAGIGTTIINTTSA
jgi:hypothetical protein